MKKRTNQEAKLCKVNIWHSYYPDRMVRAIEKSAGILKRAGVDAEQLEKDIYEDRTQNSTGRPAESDDSLPTFTQTR